MKKLELNIMKEDYKIPSSVPEIPARLIKRILQKDPAMRPSAREIMEDEWFVKMGITTAKIE